MDGRPSLLAIDPGLREMGVAHFLGSDLIDYGVKSLRRTYSRIPVLKTLAQIMTRLIKEKMPDAIAIEKTCFPKGFSESSVDKAIALIERLAQKNRIPVYEFAAGTIKKTVTGDGRATKRIIARVVSAKFKELKVYRESHIHWKERYNQNLFDAVACGLTYLAFKKDGNLSNYEISNNKTQGRP
ncbi:putative Crossover junction endodeoxyribonuclease RuvC [Candidatus Zixiibacteriota bacterium]|nr:putative Crossover junction endodeoxyribonuclease RuvC [candidate division Zixibacteria bacterium]